MLKLLMFICPALRESWPYTHVNSTHKTKDKKSLGTIRSPIDLLVTISAPLKTHRMFNHFNDKENN